MMTSAKPAIDVNVDLKAQKLQDDVYEMTLFISARAVAEGQYAVSGRAGLCRYFSDQQRAGRPRGDDHYGGLPFVLFPFARRVIADVSRDGGFPPLMLDPIDFHALYLQNRSSKAASGS